MSGEVVALGDVIWIERYARGYELVRFDSATAIARTTRLDYPVGLIHADDGSLWAIGPYGGAPGPASYTVSRVNLETGHLRNVADVPAAGGVSVGLRSIWTVTDRGLRQLDRATGEVLARWDIPGDAVQVACGAVWSWEWGGAETLTRLDPVTSDEQSFEGSGPVYEIGGECWRFVQDDGGEKLGVERLWPGPPHLTVTRAASSLQYDGKAFWRRPYGLIQAWDPKTGESEGTTFVIDKVDINPYWKIGDDGIVVAAADTLWLINGWEVVGFDIPAG